VILHKLKNNFWRNKYQKVSPNFDGKSGTWHVSCNKKLRIVLTITCVNQIIRLSKFYFKNDWAKQVLF